MLGQYKEELAKEVRDIIKEEVRSILSGKIS